MVKRNLCLFAVILAAGLAGPAESTNRSGGPRRIGPRCEPAVPILSQDVAANVEPGGIHSCHLITAQDEWIDYCATNLLACEPQDRRFFEQWTMVAIVVETTSPILCENVGPMPRWRIGCLSERRGILLARVEQTLAGSGCDCSAGPQTPRLLFLVQAVPRTSATECHAWQEAHLTECLGP